MVSFTLPVAVPGPLLPGYFPLPFKTSSSSSSSSYSFPYLNNNNNAHLSPHFSSPSSPLSKPNLFTSFSNFRRYALGNEAQDGFLSSNVSEDSDEMFDDLFNKYGKVVFRSNDRKSPTAEVDDDAESLAFAVEMAKVANEVKAADIKVLFVKPLVYWTRFFIIATAFSRPQIDAIRSRMRDLAEKEYGKVANGDAKPNSWTLLDFGDVVIHLFLPPQRTFYNLEDFYGNAMPIQLPFEAGQSPPRSS